MCDSHCEHAGAAVALVWRVVFKHENSTFTGRSPLPSCCFYAGTLASGTRQGLGGRLSFTLPRQPGTPTEVLIPVWEKRTTAESGTRKKASFRAALGGICCC